MQWFYNRSIHQYGLKHSAAIGEALAALVIDGTTRVDLDAFKLDRFGEQSGPG